VREPGPGAGEGLNTYDGPGLADQIADASRLELSIYASVSFEFNDIGCVTWIQALTRVSCKFHGSIHGSI
jgi:hypothetical protein